jgi:hypothetical protein
MNVQNIIDLNNSDVYARSGLRLQPICGAGNQIGKKRV